MDASTQTRVTALVRFALSVLPRMYQQPQRLFCFKMIEREGQIVPVDVSLRYTAMTIVGLRTAARHGHALPFDVNGLLDGLLSHTNDRLLLGDIGLVLWAASVTDPERAEPVFRIAEQQWQHQDAQDLPSMHVEWLISGLCALLTASPNRPAATALLNRAYERLVSRHREAASGLFYYRASQRSGVRKASQSPACYFAEQVYGVQALHRYATVTGNGEAAAAALHSAETLCRLQRPNGGWPWIYDPRTGAVLDVYPVYSVHQLGMGPMALLPLDRPAIRQSVERGIGWEFGANEIGQSLWDERREVIWRSIKARYLPRQRQVLHKIRATLMETRPSNQPPFMPRQFAIDRETRPYELGWLLEALSEASQAQRP